jgi:hypothetical protein
VLASSGVLNSPQAGGISPSLIFPTDLSQSSD